MPPDLTVAYSLSSHFSVARSWRRSKSARRSVTAHTSGRLFRASPNGKQCLMSPRKVNTVGSLRVILDSNYCNGLMQGMINFLILVLKVPASFLLSFIIGLFENQFNFATNKCKNDSSSI